MSVTKTTFLGDKVNERLNQFLRFLEAEKPEFLPPQLDVMGLVRRLAITNPITAAQELPQKLAQSQQMLDEYTPGQQIDPRLLEQFMGLTGFAPAGITKPAVKSLADEYYEVSSRVQDIYKKLQAGSDDPNVLAEYKTMRARRDELMPQVKLEQATPETQGLLDVSYRGSHTAPKADVYGATLDRLEGIMPADVYSSRGISLYGLGDAKVDAEWYKAAYKAKGKPDAEITIYRAVPKGVKDINDGDWVTTSKEYAKQHGERTLDGDYEIVSKKVRAKTLSTEGYPYEFGYNETVVK